MLAPSADRCWDLVSGCGNGGGSDVRIRGGGSAAVAVSRVHQVAALVAVLALAFYSSGARSDRPMGVQSTRVTSRRCRHRSRRLGHRRGRRHRAGSSHRRAGPGDAGTLEVSTGDYRLTFQTSGFTYRPAAAAGSLTIGTESLVRGGQRIGLDLGRMDRDRRHGRTRPVAGRARAGDGPQRRGGMGRRPCRHEPGRARRPRAPRRCRRRRGRAEGRGGRADAAA